MTLCGNMRQRRALKSGQVMSSRSLAVHRAKLKLSGLSALSGLSRPETTEIHRGNFPAMDSQLLPPRTR